MYLQEDISWREPQQKNDDNCPSKQESKNSPLKQLNALVFLVDSIQQLTNTVTQILDKSVFCVDHSEEAQMTRITNVMSMAMIPQNSTLIR